MALRHPLSQKSKIFASSPRGGAEGATAPQHPSNSPLNSNLFSLCLHYNILILKIKGEEFLRSL